VERLTVGVTSKLHLVRAIRLSIAGEPAPRRLVVGVLLIAVAIVVGWVHYPALGARTIWLDDEQYVTKNPLVLNPGWESAERFLSEVQHPSTVGGYYQPLSMISLMLDCAAGGRPDRLQPFHQTALVLHVLNTMLIIALLVLLFGEPYTAAMVGLLFGVHPLTVEPLSWISERKTLLAAFFTLGALIAYVMYARAGVLDRADTSGSAGARSSRIPSPGTWYAGSIACYALALLSKPTSTPLPLLLLLLDYWPLQRLRPRAILEKTPFFLLGLIAAGVTLLSQQNASALAYPSEQSPGSILLALCHNVVFYFLQMIRPAHLSAYYPFPDPMALSDPMVLAGVVGTGVLLLFLVGSLRWTRALFTGWLFFLVALFPTMGVIRFTNAIASDKYVYLPSVGLIMILAWLLGRCWSSARGAGNRGRAVQAVICIVVLVLAAAEAAATRRYLAIWQDAESLYGYVLADSPQAWALQYNFADILAEQGRMEEAVSHYLQSVAVHPDDVDAQQNLGNALFSLGRTDEAAVHYKKVLQLQPNNVAVIYNLGLAFAQLGRSDEAVAMLRRVLRFDPNNVRANNELGLALVKQGNPEQAVAYYRAAAQLQPDFVEAHVNLADTLQAIGQSTEAVAQYRMALQLDPNDPAVHNNLAVVLTEQGMIDEAITHYRAALRLNPALHDVQANLREALARRGTPGGRTQ
jgi:tetratricopeptide (TPR) repeat protein